MDLQAGNQDRNFVGDLAPLADSLSKGVAAIAIAVYTCGFLTVSLHHARFGFIGTNPFRPRILAAGAWFLLFSAIPTAVAVRYSERTWINIAESLFFVWSLFNGIGIPLFYMLFGTAGGASDSPYSHWIYWAWGVASFLALGLYLFATNSKKAPTILRAVTSVAIVLLMSVLQLQGMLITRDFQQGYLTLWFLGVFLVIVLEIKTRSKGKLLDAVDWSKPIATLLLILLIFAQYYYPHIKASWGGGTPTPVTLYLSKDSAIKPNQAVSVQLIEESDEGFYVVSPKETRAVYLPRNAVALIYFSDNVAGSALLRDK